jgi:hypothetical protein
VLAFTFAAFLQAAMPCLADQTVALLDEGPGEVTANVPLNDNPWTFYQEWGSQGVVTLPHLGRVTVTGSQTLTFTDGTAPYQDGAHGVISGEITYTTPDGSELRGTYEGWFRRSDNDPDHPPVHLHAVIDFGGGTGRLDEVTGSAELDVYSPGLRTPNFTYTIIGILTFHDRGPSK